MRIKYTLVTLLLIGFSNAALAAAISPCPKDFSNLAKSQPKCIEEPGSPIVYNRSYQYYMYQYPYFYFDVGIGAYNLKNPTVSVGNVFNTTTPIASIDNDGFTPIYNFNLGYAFYNPHSSIFGHFNDVALKISYFSTNDKKQHNLTGKGEIWYIDGGGKLGIFGHDIYGCSLSAKHQLIDTGLYYRSIPSVADMSKFTMHPRVGLVFTNLEAKYNYVLNYNTGAASANNTEEYKVSTNYYGIAAGHQLDFHIVPQVLLYADVELQLLHAVSDLDANQQADSSDPTPLNTRSVNESSSKGITYRAIASLGAKYFIMHKANSVSLDVKAGLDRFGYNPRVVTPSSANNGRKIHLEGTAQNNFFATLDLTVPLG